MLREWSCIVKTQFQSEIRQLSFFYPCSPVFWSLPAVLSDCFLCIRSTQESRRAWTRCRKRMKAVTGAQHQNSRQLCNYTVCLFVCFSVIKAAGMKWCWIVYALTDWTTHAWHDSQTPFFFVFQGKDIPWEEGPRRLWRQSWTGEAFIIALDLGMYVK